DPPLRRPVGQAAGRPGADRLRRDVRHDDGHRGRRRTAERAGAGAAARAGLEQRDLRADAVPPDAAGGALAAAAGPAHPGRHPAAGAAASARVEPRMGGRLDRAGLLPVHGLVRHQGRVGQLEFRGAEHQDTGHAGVVAAGAVAGHFHAAGHRNGLPHAAPACRRARPAARRGERSV
ncbi:MAG: TRAP-type transport system, small permease component, predicted N-acetylneuraminate transporter, partial [uncultured Ramlibacter sp.]